MLLEREGYKVTSALGFTQSVARCKENGFDLLILGHSIPDADKYKLIETFRKANPAPVLSLQRHGESPVDTADYAAPVDDPGEFLKTVARILKS
jgi:DNA-binding response OmpR family regulator